MDKVQKARENRLRNAAKRQGLELQRHRARDSRHILYGTYQLVRLPDGEIHDAREHPAFGRQYGMTLDEVAKALGERSALAASNARMRPGGQVVHRDGDIDNNELSNVEVVYPEESGS